MKSFLRFLKIKSSINPFWLYRIWSRDKSVFISRYASKNDTFCFKYYLSNNRIYLIFQLVTIATILNLFLFWNSLLYNINTLKMCFWPLMFFFLLKNTIFFFTLGTPYCLLYSKDVLKYALKCSFYIFTIWYNVPWQLDHIYSNR